ncbi:MAG: M14 family metallopeptidase [Fidelibacterota bacterium]
MKASNRVVVCILTLFLAGLSPQTPLVHRSPGLGDYDVPFYPEGTYLPDVTSPGDFLGFELGSRPVTHEEVLGYFEYLNEAFSNASLHTYGHTYEGRRLVYLVITSEDNSRGLEAIRERLGKLADPRTLKREGEADRIIKTTPAVAWMAYAIHGDELSSTDAALQLAYQLLAGTDAVSEKIRDNLVVSIDPLQNPDGRTRFVGQLEQVNSAIPSTDTQSLQHRGMWPWGRGNHYLFDLNRDWFCLVHPETRGKVKAILHWHPQLVVDCHEMGAYDTYLFNPPREPYNPFMSSQIQKWWEVFSRDHARAFDRYGWSYYTREWNEELFPGYGSSWPIYLGAVGILYEQAGVDGSQVKRPDGTVMTYRETVHHQFISSMANLTTASENRQALLRDYYEQRREAVDSGARSGTPPRRGAFLVPATTNQSRLVEFAETLQAQGIEIQQATVPFKERGVVSRDGQETREMTFPEGTLIIPLNQPHRNLVEAILTFDIRLPTAFLEKEKESRLKKGETKVYDVTGWSLPLAYDLETYVSGSVPSVKKRPFASPGWEGKVVGSSPRVGYLFSGADDRSYLAAARFLEKGVNLWCSRKPFEVEGREYPRGSFLLRLSANPDLDRDHVEAVAREAGITIYGVNTGLASSGSDLGGNEFVRLVPPKIAVVAGSPMSTYSVGAVWHLMDHRMKMRISLVHAMDLGSMDLRKYNVLLLPGLWGGPQVYKRILGDSGMDRLRDWVKDGGTLVAVGTASAFVADTSVAFTGVRQKRQVLSDWQSYEAALRLVREAEAPMVDSLDVWEARMPEEKMDKEPSLELSELKLADETARKLSPGGTILMANLDTEHWLSFGCGKDVPVLVNTSYAYVAKTTEVAARLAPAESLRLSGLLWPEARDRWADTIYAGREAMGRGQVILFATQPNFRGYFRGGERMLLNALILGPGFGTHTGVEW